MTILLYINTLTCMHSNPGAVPLLCVLVGWPQCIKTMRGSYEKAELIVVFSPFVFSGLLDRQRHHVGEHRRRISKRADKSLKEILIAREPRGRIRGREDQHPV
jgi:hypothetical protein